MERLFFAFKPDAVTARHIVDTATLLQKNLGLRGKLLKADCLHVTLLLLGDFPYLPRDVVAVASRAAQDVVRRSSVTAFDLAIDRAMSFRRKSGASPFAAQVGLGKEPLMQLWMELNSALTSAGLLANPRPLSTFKPHVTLMYGDAAPSAHPIDPIEWNAGELVLVHSLLGKTKHESLAQWPLQT